MAQLSSLDSKVEVSYNCFSEWEFLTKTSTLWNLQIFLKKIKNFDVKSERSH
jgi:hypothetical protein